MNIRQILQPSIGLLQRSINASLEDQGKHLFQYPDTQGDSGPLENALAEPFRYSDNHSFSAKLILFHTKWACIDVR